MSTTALAFAIRLAAVVLLAQADELRQTVPPEVAAKTPPTKGWQDVVQFAEQVKTLGPWQAQHRTITQMVDAVFTRNKWNSESDLFARSLITQASALPPWDIKGRIDTVVGQVSTRYQLTADQQHDLRLRVWSDIITLTTQSFPTLMPTLKEMLETRAAGEPFTPEQIGRWTRTMRPIMNRNMQHIRRSIREFRQTLSPDQQAVFDRDLRAADRRAATVLNKMSDWEQGKWKPADWGLERDPIHRAAAGIGPAGGRTPPAGRRASARPLPSEPGAAALMIRDRDEWEQYVENFITRYELDEGQQTTAWSIYKEIKSRADQWQASHAEEVAELESQVSASDDSESRRAAEQRLSDRTKPLQEMFGELKTRLDNLLTGEQRTQGGAD